MRFKFSIMIYKRQKVRGVRISAGQVVNAPVASFTLRSIQQDGGSRLDDKPVKVRFAGVKASPVMRDEFEQSEYLRHTYPGAAEMASFAALVPDRPKEYHDPEVRAVSWDVSESIYIELRGEFESCPLVMLEGVLDASSGRSKHVASMRPITFPDGILSGGGAKTAPSTSVYPDAYVLLQDAYFTGEVIFHNTTQDRNTPFRWPVFYLPMLTPLPMYRDGRFYHAQINDTGAMAYYAAAWARKEITPPLLVSVSGDDSPGDDFLKPDAWRVMQLDPTGAYPCLAMIIPTNAGHHLTTINVAKGDLAGFATVRSLRQSVWATQEIACMSKPDWESYPRHEEPSSYEKAISGITLLFEIVDLRGHAPVAMTVSTAYAVQSAGVWKQWPLETRARSFAHNPAILMGPVPPEYQPTSTLQVVCGIVDSQDKRFAVFNMKNVVDGIVNEELLKAHTLAIGTPDCEAPGLWVLESSQINPSGS